MVCSGRLWLHTRAGAPALMVAGASGMLKKPELRAMPWCGLFKYV